MKVLITGSNGFIGKNLKLHLTVRKDVQVVCFTKNDDVALLPTLLEDVDFVFHLAGVNRTQDVTEFVKGNLDLTNEICKALGLVAKASAKRIPIVFSSSIQATLDNPYGLSKLKAENALFTLQKDHGVPVYVFRLPNVFGKWCKPNYNSVVATFCHNIAGSFPIQINDPDVQLMLVYVDDVVRKFIQIMDGAFTCRDTDIFETVEPEFSTTVGELANQIQIFKDSRTTLLTERVGTGLVKALYATYLSYLQPAFFTYTLPQYSDTRGVFTEMLKTPDCGQFSYFTAYPGITRGGHYHNTKTEKFLVIKGQACFKFRHMLTGERYELITSGDKAEVVETVPGWTHDITNIGNNEMVVMLWANEVFDREQPDTFSYPL